MTATNVTVQQAAADPKTGMTLDELSAFVAEALRRDIDGDKPIRVTTGFKSQIRSLEVKSA